MREEAKRLIEMVRKGVPDKEIMEKLGFQTKASLKMMYYDALVDKFTVSKRKDSIILRKVKEEE